LEKEQELRIEVESKGLDVEAAATIKLLEGTAEVFGTELAQDHPYTFRSGTKSAVFSWHGCNLELIGNCHAYLGKETQMASYIAVHNHLEQRRDEAKNISGDGPRVMVVGPTDTGKSSLCKILVSYAARLGRLPTFVDLDVGQGCCVPGMMSAVPIERPVDVVEGFEFTAPLVYFFGQVSPGPNAELYRLQVANIWKDIEKRHEMNKEAKASGLIINTCGWVDGLGYELILNALETMKVDVVLVMDQERLYNDLLGDVAKLGRSIQVTKLNKSGGVVTRDTDYRRRSRMDKIKEYFYGPTGDLSPHSTLVDFEDIVLLRVGGGPQAPSSALPIGAERTVNPTRLLKVTPSSEILHSVLGVSHARTQEAVLETNLAGFVYVTEVNLEKRKVTLLAPCPGPLPGKYVLVGSLKWYE